MQNELVKSADLTLRESLNLRRQEQVQIICDPPSFEVANALYDAATHICKEAVLTVINTRKEDDGELPEPLAVSLVRYDVVVMVTSRQLSQSSLKHYLAQSGVRVAMLPGVTSEMFRRVTQVDWRKLGAYTRRVAAQLSTARTIRITSETGTDLLIEKGDNKAISDDGRLSSPGAFGYIPAGEVYAPVYPTCEGVASIGGSFSLCPGLLEKPLVIEFKAGVIKKVLEHPCAAQLEKHFSLYRQINKTITTFGVGTLESAIVSGNCIEDKKSRGAVNLTFGTDDTIKSGFGEVGVLVMTNVFLDGKIWIKNGEIL